MSCNRRHATELRHAGADKTCIVNSEAGLNLGAQLLGDLGTSETAISLLRRGINEALAVRTAADKRRAQLTATTSASSNGTKDATRHEMEAAAAAAKHKDDEESSQKKRKRRHEMFVLDGRHAYGLRAEALRSAAASPTFDGPCKECPLVSNGSLSSTDSAASSAMAALADADAAVAAAARAVDATGSGGTSTTA